MKRIATFMAAIAMFAASSVASAADNLWFSMISAPAGVTAVGGSGQELVINNPGLAAGVVRVGVNITAPATLAGYSLSLLASPGGSFANGLAQGSGYDQNIGDIAAGPAVTFGRGSSSTAGSTGLIFSFDLVLQAGAAPIVTGDFGPDGILYNTGLFWRGFVGNNGFSYAGPAYPGDDTPVGWGLNPVIRVTPEPTTLVLLGLGAVALIRRRK